VAVPTVTVTSSTPAASAGAVAVIEVAELTTTPVAAVDPNWTVAPVAKPAPVTVTEVPPVVGPPSGLTPVTSSVPKVNWSAEEVDEVPLPVVTVTSTEPAAPAGDVASRRVDDSTVTAVAAVVPKDTVAPGTNPVPETVTTVPPAAGPPAGERPVTIGPL